MSKELLDQTEESSLPAEIEKLKLFYDSEVGIIDIDSNLVPDEVAQAIRGGQSDGIIFVPGQESFIYLSLSKNRVVVVGPMTRLGPPFDINMVLLILGASILVIIIVGFLLARPVVQRLKKLQETAIRISRGELEARTEDNSKDEIGELSNYFNLMAEKNQSMIQNQKRLLEAVSHELRTPTARVRFGLEMLSTAKTNEDKQKRLQSIDEDLSEIDELVEELLLYNRLDQNTPSLKKIEINAADVCRKLVARLGQQEKDINIELDVKDEPNCVLLGELKSFSRAIKNILLNAIRYSRQEIKIICFRDENQVVVQVDDDGPGIALENRQSVFNPFSRVDDSRNRDSGGVGLGLAIVQRILKAHQGRVTIEQSASGGASFVTRWPVG
jgi:two-component system sensor histidine kinase RstB